MKFERPPAAAPDADFGPRAVSAAIWSAFGHWLARLISPLVFLVLARVLAPQDFGIAAVATMVIAFCQVVAESGMGKVIVQRQHEGENIHEVATNAFWTNLAMSVLLFLAIVAAAPALASLFSEPRSVNVIRVQALQLLFSPFYAIPLALLQRELNYRAIFWMQSVTTFLAGLLSIPLALSGMGYWALVLGSLAGALVSAIWAWLASPWRPSLRIDRKTFPGMLRFGAYSTGEGISGWMFAWLDSILVGIYLSAHELGLYRTASSAVALLAGLIVAPLVPVIFRAFSIMQHDRERLHASYLTAIQLMTMVSVLTSIVLLATFPFWPSLVFGSQWQGVEAPLFIFLMLYAYGGLSYANPELFRALGRPDVPLIMNGIVLAAYFTGFVLALSVSFEAFLLTRYCLAVLSILAQVVALKVIAGITPRAFFGRTGPSLAVFVAFVATGTALSDAHAGWGVASGALLGAILIYVNRRQWLDALRSVRSATSGSSGRS